ncbi:hypothetical protein L2E82_08305 [Cichorium intybus]|uniref:Uncharacterized protein n=1 Tax=Cichorium intybus TaxID=13427 RepID=A0ACB9G7A7_CICIN|nr:hypothetical protein L2E82_08305 [Cichorium intybus]
MTPSYAEDETSRSNMLSFFFTITAFLHPRSKTSKTDSLVLFFLKTLNDPLHRSAWSRLRFLKEYAGFRRDFKIHHVLRPPKSVATEDLDRSRRYVSETILHSSLTPDLSPMAIAADGC